MNTSLTCSHDDSVSNDQTHNQRASWILRATWFITVHVGDLIVVGLSSQLCEVVGGMKQYFTMKVIPPLSASSTQTYVGARYLRHHDAFWELPTTRYVEGMLDDTQHKECKTCGHAGCGSQR